MYVKIARIFSAYGAGLKQQIFWDMFRKYRKNGSLDLFGTSQEKCKKAAAKDLTSFVILLCTYKIIAVSILHGYGYFYGE